MPLPVGTKIGPYEIRGLLGAGGMGEVYLAWDPRLGREVALKRMTGPGAEDPEWRSRFMSEARVVAGLRHSGIVAVHDILWEESTPYIVMERLDGETLRERLIRGAIPEDAAHTMWLQAVHAMAAAHGQGLIHRDLKPENLFLTREGNLKVLDFGLAKRLDTLEGDATLALETSAGAIMGTLAYLSPEQARGEGATRRSDVHALGLILLEMLTGRAAFRRNTTAETLSAILVEDPLDGTALPAWAAALLGTALAKDPTRRPADAADLLEGSSQPLRNERVAPSRKWTRPLIAAGFATAAGLLGLWGWRMRPSAEGPAAMKPRGVVAHSVNTASSSPAYDAYMRGKVMVNSENREDNETAIKLLELATAQDRNFAPAYAELARAYNRKSFYYAPGAEKKRLNVDAEVSVERALALDPDLAEAHSARGMISWTHAKRFPHEQAIRSFQRAIALNPKLDDPHHQLAVIYFHIGLLDKAWAEIEKALEIKPDNTMARFRFGVIRLYQARYEEALAVFKSTPPEINPSLVGFQKANALLHLGKQDEASVAVETYLKIHPEDEGGTVTSVKAMLLAKTGRRREAEATIQRAIRIGEGFGHFHHTAYNIASAHALLDNRSEALRWLEVAADDGFPCYPLFEKDTNLNSLRKDERFIAFMAQRRKQWEEWKRTL